MSVRRTPPPAPASPAMPPLAHCKSDSNITKSVTATMPVLSRDNSMSDPNVAMRKRKREDEISREEILRMFAEIKRDQDEKYIALMNQMTINEQTDTQQTKGEGDIISMFTELKKEQNLKFTELTNKVHVGIQTHTEQNSAIASSIDFLSQKYEEVVTRVHTLEQEKAEDRKYIKTLEMRLEHVDRILHSTTLEVRNVPKKAGESKEDLLRLVKQVGTTLGVPIQQSDVRDVYRINTKKDNYNQPIVAQLSTVILRDKIVGSVKAYNKKYATSKLSTSNLKLEGPPKPIFVSEGLTPQAKKVFFLAREFAKSNGIKYCWTSRGKIYLRRSDGSPLIKVNTESELDNIKNK